MQVETNRNGQYFGVKFHIKQINCDLNNHKYYIKQAFQTNLITKHNKSFAQITIALHNINKTTIPSIKTTFHDFNLLANP
uniref:Uncharacterized protein MANES_14G085000 n=1 Tax=Rhizophora mucronata TaxID=61149 RepID=A0A2P2KYK5_RHIMU